MCFFVKAFVTSSVTDLETYRLFLIKTPRNRYTYKADTDTTTRDLL
jgi:hypothetical protein